MICRKCRKAVMEIEFIEGIPAGVKCPRCGHTESHDALMEMERGD